jgi:hypothetical protein
MIYREGTKYVVALTTSYYVLWKRTYEYICDTEDEVKNLVIPYDKLYINDAIPINIRPRRENLESTYWDCILQNNKLHKGEIRIS